MVNIIFAQKDVFFYWKHPKIYRKLIFLLIFENRQLFALTWRRSGFFIDNFGHTLHLFLVFYCWHSVCIYLLIKSLYPRISRIIHTCCMNSHIFEMKLQCTRRLKSEPATGGVLYKEAFLEISQNSQENTWWLLLIWLGTRFSIRSLKSWKMG